MNKSLFSLRAVLCITMCVVFAACDSAAEKDAKRQEALLEQQSKNRDLELANLEKDKNLLRARQEKEELEKKLGIKPQATPVPVVPTSSATTPAPEVQAEIQKKARFEAIEAEAKAKFAAKKAVEAEAGVIKTGVRIEDPNPVTVTRTVSTGARGTGRGSEPRYIKVEGWLLKVPGDDTRSDEEIRQDPKAQEAAVRFRHEAEEARTSHHSYATRPVPGLSRDPRNDYSFQAPARRGW